MTVALSQETPSPLRPNTLHRSPWSPRRVVLAVIVGMTVCVLAHLKITHDKTLHDAETLVSALANASEQHIGGSLSAIDTLLDELANTIQTGRHENIRFSNDILTRLSSYPEIRFIGIVSADGFLQPQTWPRIPVPDWGLNVSDRRYYTAQRDSTAPPHMIIGETVVGRASNERTLHVSRPIRDRNGQFLGVVVAAINPDYYAWFLSSILYDDAGSCGLIGTDGRIIARAPNHEQTFGRDISDSDLIQLWAPRAPIGVAHLVAKTDGNDKLLAYRVMPDIPLLVTAGISRDKAMGSWIRMAWIEGALLTAFSALLLYWGVRVAKNREVLRQEQEKLEQMVLDRTSDLIEARTLAERRSVQLGWVNDELKRLTLVASHHLQEPLRSIVSYSQMIRRSITNRSAELDAVIDTLCQEGADMKTRLGEFENHVAVLTGSLKQPDFPVITDTGTPPTPEQPQTAKTSYTSRLVAGLIILTVLGGTAMQLRVDYVNSIHSAENLTTAVVKSIDYHISTSIRRIDGLLNEVALVVEDNRHLTPEFRDRLMSRLATMPEIRHVATSNEYGLMSAHTWPDRGLPSHGLDISDREYFIRQSVAVEPGRLVVGLPRIGRVAGERSIQLSHPLLGPTGKFAGIVFASINPDVYAKYLDSLLLDESGASAIISLDGRMLARSPNHVEKFGIDISNSDLFTQWIPHALSGVAHLVSKADGNDKLLGYRVLQGYPLVVTSGISRRIALQEWYVVAGFGGLLALIASITLYHWAKRADQYANTLRVYRNSLSNMMTERTAGVSAAHLAAESRAAHLAQVNEKLHDLTRLIAKDLQQPLHTLGGHILTLHQLAGPADGDSQRWLSYVNAGNTHLNALLRDFQRFVHIFANTPNLAEIDSTAAVNSAIAAIRTRWSEAEIVFDLSPLPRIRADMDMISDLFLELFSNAAVHRGGTSPAQVRVKAFQRGKQWLFSISDNGPGLPTHLGDRIFQAFETAHNRDPDSTGLGLPLCRIVVQSHGGRIWIEPNDAGSTICFALPGL